MARLLWICLGGAIGTGARYLIVAWAARAFGPTFPFGTMLVNAAGSFLLGALMFLSLETATLSPAMRLALTTGAMGGFTTYSSFSYETMALLHRGEWASAALNVGLTVFGCLAACFAGWAVARSLVGT